MATVTSVRNPAVRAARKLSRPGRRRDDAFLVEGPRAAGEAVGHLERVFATAAAQRAHAGVVDRARGGGAEVVTVTDTVLAAIATTVRPQGLVGVARLPAPSLAEALAGARLVLVCWEVRDPGNAGTVVRTADAAGADAVVLAGDSVDPRNPKAVRASAGSLFHLPVAEVTDWASCHAALRAAGLRLVAADAAAGQSYTDADLTVPAALLLGGEARGLPPDVRGSCDEAVAVPIHGRAESLNLAAAAAVLAYEAARQRAAKMVPQ